MAHEKSRGCADDHSLLDALPIPAALLDSRGELVACNRAFARLHHQGGGLLQARAERGLDYLGLLTQLERPEFARLSRGIRDVLEGSAERYDIVLKQHTLTRSRWTKVSVTAPEDGPGALLVCADATEAQKAQALLHVVSSVSASLSTRPQLTSAARMLALSVCRELDWDFAGVRLVDQATSSLRCVATLRCTELDMTDFDKATRASAPSAGSGLPGRAWALKSVQWATDLDCDVADQVDAETGQAPKVMPAAALAAGLRTALSVPLRCGDEVLAVIDFFTRIRREPDHELMLLLEAAGEQLALGELRERAERCARLAQLEADNVRAQLEAVLSCAPGFVVNLDRAGVIRFINRKADGARRQLVGRHWSGYIPQDQQHKVQSALERVLLTGETQTYELEISVPGGGQPRWFANVMGAMRAGAEVVGAVVISQEITNSKRAQAELLASQRLAAVGTLAAGIAHEINTPIQFVNDSMHFLQDASRDLIALVDTLLAVRNLAQEAEDRDQLRRAADDAMQAEQEADLPYLVEHVPKAVERSLHGLERVAAIVRSMKEFAHPAQEHMAPADLNRAIRATLTVASNEYKHVADLETSLEQLPPITCHINDINQVVLNLVVNAAHAVGEVVKDSGKKGTIRVATRMVRPSIVEISVADTGCGIPLAVRERVFDPFFTTKEVGKGTGQGLSMAWATIREGHAGKIAFETEEGRGTTFRIELPITGKAAG